jgi:putative oxidoreductase
MELITRTLASTEENPTLRIEPNGFQETPQVFLQTIPAAWDDSVHAALQRWSIPALRLALGVVFLWFGALKVFGVSPITPLLRETYSFMALPAFTVLLGVWETLIGIGLILKLALRHTLVLLCLHLAGTFVAIWLSPSHFFLHDNPLVLTENGEFVVKNLVLLTAGLVIGGHELSHLPKRFAQAQIKGNERTNEGVSEQGAT